MNALISLFLLAPALPARAYLSIDCSVRTDVDSRITRLDVAQEVGAERLECVRAGGAVSEVRVVRMVKTHASARAESEARARGSANGHYSDSCHASGSGCGSCRTSGSGSDSCSDSGSDTATRSESAETTFAVARAPLAALASHGFAVHNPDAQTCGLSDSRGVALDVLKSVAAVTWVYGQELMREAGAELDAARKLAPKGLPPAGPAAGRNAESLGGGR